MPTRADRLQGLISEAFRRERDAARELSAVRSTGQGPSLGRPTLTSHIAAALDESQRG